MTAQEVIRRVQEMKSPTGLWDAVAVLVNAAVAEEREACARIAEQVADKYQRHECRQVAAQIRIKG